MVVVLGFGNATQAGLRDVKNRNDILEGLSLYSIRILSLLISSFMLSSRRLFLFVVPAWSYIEALTKSRVQFELI